MIKITLRIKNIAKLVFALIVVISFWCTLITGSPFSLYDSVKNMYNEKSIFIYKNDSCNFTIPNNKTLILRMDDVQGYLWSNISINITETVIQKNMSITLAVIPFRSIDNDLIMRDYLLNNIKNPKIEIAQHGSYHSKEEMSHLGLTQKQEEDLIKSGKVELTRVLRVMPITFIPPYNDYDENTSKSLTELKFKIISAKQGEYKMNESTNLTFIGYAVATKYDTRSDLVPIAEIINSCNESLINNSICVVLIHPQDYVNDDKKTLNETRYTEFVKLLDGLKNLNATSATFNDLINCDMW